MTEKKTRGARNRRLSSGGEDNAATDPMLPKDLGKVDRYNHHNVFRNRTEDMSPYETFKVILFTVTGIAPFRIIMFILSLAMAALFSWISLIGIPNTREGLNRPIEPWRRMVNYFSQFFARSMVFFMGYHWIPVKGDFPADAKKRAPIYITNHNGFVETVYYFALFWPCITAKAAILKWWFFGTILTATRPVWIQQGEANPMSVKETILERAKNVEKFRPLMMYPEGTTCNSEAMMHFQLGAFIPGEPVMPIITRFPWKNFDPCFVDGGRPMWQMFYRSVCQFHNRMTVELLPVYYPSEEEQKDPIMFANNVRKYMARKLDVPLSDQSLHDMLLIRKAKKMRKTVGNHYEAVLGMGYLRDTYGCVYKHAAEFMDIFASAVAPGQVYMSLESLSKSMGLPANSLLDTLFHSFGCAAPGEVRFWHFGRSMASVCHTKQLARIAENTFCALLGDTVKADGSAQSKGRTLSKDAFKKAMQHESIAGPCDAEALVKLFDAIDDKKDGVLDAEEFVKFCEADRRYLKYFTLGFVDRVTDYTK